MSVLITRKSNTVNRVLTSIDRDLKVAVRGLAALTVLMAVALTLSLTGCCSRPCRDYSSLDPAFPHPQCGSHPAALPLCVKGTCAK